MEFEIKIVNYTDRVKIKTIENTLMFLRSDYPNFISWFRTRVKIGLKKGTRKIYIAVPSENPTKIAGVLILKDESYEKKICTLCVLKEYQCHGIGSALLQQSINTLNTSKPLITVSSRYVEEFHSLFSEFKFDLFQEYPSYYLPEYIEYSFNAPIEQNFIGYIANA